jgi:hypothetical protein
MEGLDYKAYRETKQVKQLWRTTVTSVGKSADLRSAVPVLMYAAIPYVSGDTKGQVQKVIHLDWPGLKNFTAEQSR